MNRMKNLGRRIPCVLLAAAVGLSVAACSPQEGSNSIQEDSSFQGASEAPESREETPQGESLVQRIQPAGKCAQPAGG